MSEISNKCLISTFFTQQEKDYSCSDKILSYLSIIPPEKGIRQEFTLDSLFFPIIQTYFLSQRAGYCFCAITSLSFICLRLYRQQTVLTILFPSEEHQWNLWYVSDDEQASYQYQEWYQNMFQHSFHTYITCCRCNKETAAVWRCNQANQQINRHDNSKM